VTRKSQKDVSGRPRGGERNSGVKDTAAWKEMHMSSILTNTSAMIALQTLRGINANLEATQSQISTGKAVASAKDNSTVCMTLAFEE